MRNATLTGANLVRKFLHVFIKKCAKLILLPALVMTKKATNQHGDVQSREICANKCRSNANSISANLRLKYLHVLINNCGKRDWLPAPVMTKGPTNWHRNFLSRKIFWSVLHTFVLFSNYFALSYCKLYAYQHIYLTYENVSLKNSLYPENQFFLKFI